MGLPDAGSIEMRGGDPVHARDEHFSISPDGKGGYRVETRIVGASGDYTLLTECLYTADWLPREVRGRKEHRGQHQGSVSISRTATGVWLTVADATGSVRSQALTCPPDSLIDLEPSTLPMWAMTRRYDRARGGTQVFHWVGRSLLRDLTLEHLEIPLTRVGVDAGGEDFEFSETYPLPGGGSFTLPFTLRVDERSRLQRFTVGAGARQVVGVRRR